MNKAREGRVGRYYDRVRHFLMLDAMPPVMRRILVTVVGGTILLIGLALVVLPGPAFVVIPVGLVVLGTEFAWARRLVRKAEVVLERAKETVKGTR